MRNKITIFILAFATLLGAITFSASPRASADYDGGNLIDNAVFLNANSMNSDQIQNFLASKGSGLAYRSFVLQCYGAGSQER